MTPTELSRLRYAINLLENANGVACLGVLRDLAQAPMPGNQELWLLAQAPDKSNGEGGLWQSGKIETIKAVRHITHVGLSEAKALVESLPQNLGYCDPNSGGVRWLVNTGAEVEWR